MKCKHCKGDCKKDGKQNSGIQKYRCRHCGIWQQKHYKASINSTSIVALLKEGCSIRGIARLLSTSPATVIRKIRTIAKAVQRPRIYEGKEYEVDEMSTYVGNKQNRRWVAYILRRDTREVIGFVVGSRTKKTLERLTTTLKHASPRRVFTDKLNIYKSLLPREIHSTKKYSINRIERHNLTLRTHLKRLSRRTICFSRSTSMLSACLQIYFWA
jgi:insertion element IS1 protein InsB